MMKIINEFKEIDISIINIMKNGFKFSLVLSLFASYILYFYIQNPISHTVFEIGYLSQKVALMFFVCFFTGAFVFDKFKKNII